MLTNTTVVLLLVNASPIRDAKGTVVYLNGEYSDFTQGWYENVGLAILVSGSGLNSNYPDPPNPDIIVLLAFFRSS